MAQTSPTKLTAARRELELAEEELGRLRDASTLQDAERHWLSFLRHLNRVWGKVEAALKPHHSKFQPWQGKFRRTRKSDPLLRYLHHARNSDEHTLTELVVKEPGGLGINPAPGTSGLAIRSLAVRSGPSGLEIEYDGSPAAFSIISPRLRLAPAYDSGEWYQPPSEHLGSTLPSQGPLDVGRSGVKWYSAFVDAAEATFLSAAL